MLVIYRKMWGRFVFSTWLAPAQIRGPSVKESFSAKFLYFDRIRGPFFILGVPMRPRNSCNDWTRPFVLMAGLWFFGFPVPAFSSTGSWIDDLRPIAASDWNYKRAAHLLERAGFGGTPSEIEALAAMPPSLAVRQLIEFENVDNTHLRPFEPSGVHDPGLEPFPPSRPATTELAEKNGGVLGVLNKPSGNRRLQPSVDRFFYWLRASRLETHRLAYWWAYRMLHTNRPLQEKLALFWHGHFAVNETKVRDYRKMENQLAIFHSMGKGSFRELLINVSQDPAMLSYLDAGVNIKGSPNENFAREIMELFTMGVGHYEEIDIREGARAFTGWNYSDLNFEIREDEHDESEKKFLGRIGNFDGIDVIDIILDQKVTAEFIAAKLYRFFVRDDLSEILKRDLADILRSNSYSISKFLTVVFNSKDFYSSASVGTQIKAPVPLVISTYRKLGLGKMPGVPDFNDITAELGQQLFRPPSVAGWAYGDSWITPGLLIARGNFAYDVVFPDINFIPHDRFPRTENIRKVHEKISAGFDVTSATIPELDEDVMMSEANQMADRDEDFNTRLGSYRGWQMAIAKVKPIPRNIPHLDLISIIRDANVDTIEEVVDHFVSRLLSVPADPEFRSRLEDFLRKQLGTQDVKKARSYLDRPLRELIHLILSTPEYQLG